MFLILVLDVWSSHDIANKSVRSDRNILCLFVFIEFVVKVSQTKNLISVFIEFS